MREIDRETLLDNYDRKIEQQEKEIAELKAEVNKYKMESGHHQSFSFYKQEEVHNLKEELALKDRALELLAVDFIILKIRTHCQSDCKKCELSKVCSLQWDNNNIANHYIEQAREALK